jgi:hypothetical protein
MKTIYKYPLHITDTQVVTAPQGAVWLTVQVQRDILGLWAVVDPTAKPCGRTIRIYGTGQPIPDYECPPKKHIGTVQEGPLVWHIFEEEA